jgi:predicted flap endonuclease-1-like 5' DNA nuclease
VSKLSELEAIGPDNARRLSALGIDTTEEYVERAATTRGRHDLADRTGISDHLILEWINHLDLQRVQGLDWKYADLLEEAGVETLSELAQANAAKLSQKLAEISQPKNLGFQPPSETEIADWIAQAQALPKVIQYYTK